MQINTILNFRFKMTDLGKLSWIEKILSKFGKADCKPHSNSCEMDIKKTCDKVNFIDSKTYHEIIGSLIYIMVATRLVISYTVTSLTQDLAKANSFHIMKAMHILCYLKTQSVTHI